LIMIIYKSFIKAVINDSNITTILKYFYTKFDLLELVLIDLRRYTLLVREKIKSNTEKDYSNIDTFSSEIFEGLFSHAENLNVRLDIIYFICSNLGSDSNQSFNEAHLEILWKHLYTESNSEFEKNVLFKFLGNRGLEYK